MRIQVYTSSRRTNDGSTSSKGPSLDTNNLLSIFPKGITLNRIHSDHIYSSLHTNQTTESGDESSESNDDSLDDTIDEVDDEEPIKPRVITRCIRKIGTPELSSRLHIDKVQPHEEEIGGEGSKHERSLEGQCPLNNNIEIETAVGNEHGPECEHYTLIPTDNRFVVTNTGNIPYDDENDMLSLNADSIQKVFQNTIYMTSFTPISEGTNKRDNNQYQQTSLGEDNHNTPHKELHVRNDKLIGSNNNSEFQPFKIYDKCFDRKGQKCVKLRTDCTGSTDNTPTPIKNSGKESNMLNKPMSSTEEECPISPTSKLYKNDSSNQKAVGCRVGKGNTSDKFNKNQKTDHRRLHNDGNTTTTGKRDDSTKPMCQTVNDKEYREISRDMENDRELFVKINYTLDLLVRKWCEYLTMTADQIRDMEIQNAKDMNMIEGVIEMLEDNDRYVWELIDELKFF